MKKSKSQVKHLIILGAISIFFAAFLAQAAGSANAVEFSTAPLLRFSQKGALTYRTIEGTIDSAGVNYLVVKTGEKKFVTVKLNRATQIYYGNATTTVSGLKINAAVKVRAQIKTSGLEATAVKMTKITAPTPAAVNN
ncbi:MAG: hypothetical protein V1846_01530 [Candidatus Komeilibacteria bacterium]